MKDVARVQAEFDEYRKNAEAMIASLAGQLDECRLAVALRENVEADYSTALLAKDGQIRALIAGESIRLIDFATHFQGTVTPAGPATLTPDPKGEEPEPQPWPSVLAYPDGAKPPAEPPPAPTEAQIAEEQAAFEAASK